MKKINLKRKLKGQSRMDNPEGQTPLGIRNRIKTNKTIYKSTYYYFYIVHVEILILHDLSCFLSVISWWLDLLVEETGEP
jgi:hypothetical protein